MTRREIGSYGETRAAEYIAARGYSVICRNYHSRFGEIDIIAVCGGYIVFIEVKLRKNNRPAEAREFVTRSKQQKIITTAKQYLQELAAADDPEPRRAALSPLQPRFDVIEIYAPEGEASELIGINHIENAFE